MKAIYILGYVLAGAVFAISVIAFASSVSNGQTADRDLNPWAIAAAFAISLAIFCTIIKCLDDIRGLLALKNKGELDVERTTPSA
jgi:hypothetical protein